jgi:hypothetical protein
VDDLAVHPAAKDVSPWQDFCKSCGRCREFHPDRSTKSRTNHTSEAHFVQRLTGPDDSETML